MLVGALRNARRAGVDLAEQARLANEGLGEYARDGGFVTGQIARIDLSAETATIVNAGHPASAAVARRSRRAVALEADPPFGTVRDRGTRCRTCRSSPATG